MKNFKNYLVLVCTVFVFASCDQDIIDLTERDRLPTAQALANLDGTRATLLQAYEFVRSSHENQDISMYKQCGTDLVAGGTNMNDVTGDAMPAMNSYNANLGPASSGVSSVYNNLDFALNRINVVLTFIDNFEPSNDAEETDKNQIKGEALTLRAIVFLEQVQRWDNVVLALELPDEIVFDVNLSPREQVYAQIIKDCEEAIPLLQTRSQLPAPNVGVAARGVAYHILSKAHMDMGNWAAAATAAEGVIGDASYSFAPLGDIFTITGGKEGNENNSELLLSWVFDPGVTNRAQRTSQMYVPLYDRVVGVLRLIENGGRAWSRLSPSPYYWSLFDEDDLRLQAWHKTEWVFDDVDNLPEGVSEGDVVTVDDIGDVNPRYIEPTTTKFWEDGTYGRTIGEAEGYRNIIVYRLSEAYLIGAEAHWRAGNNGRALELMNAVRERAFGNSDHNFASLDEDTILEEHARELGHEGHRWAMLKRLGLLVERVGLYNPDAAGIEAKHVRWPIPQTFIDLTGVEQNPGY